MADQADNRNKPTTETISAAWEPGAPSMTAEALQALLYKAEQNASFAKPAQVENWRRDLEWYTNQADPDGVSEQEPGPEPAKPLQRPLSWQALPPNTLIQKLHERRISDQAIAVFEIQPAANGRGVVYPVCGELRQKNLNTNLVKYFWVESEPENPPVLYSHPDLLDAINQADGALWLASGEADVWALYSAGIHHAACMIPGERNPTPELLTALQTLGVLTVYIAPDVDAKGRSWARVMAGFFENSGIELDVRQIPVDEPPYNLTEAADLGELWRVYTGRAHFERFLLGLRRVYPEPKRPEPKPERNPATNLNPAYLADIATALGVEYFGPNGWANGVCCPFHDDRVSSASLHETTGLYCHTCGKQFTWVDTGRAVGVGNYLEWQIRNPGKIASAVCLATETREALIAAGAASAARLLDALYNAGAKPGDVVTISQAADLTGLTYQTARRALQATITLAPDGAAGGRLASAVVVSQNSKEPENGAHPEKTGRRELFTKTSPVFYSMPRTTAKNVNNSKRGPKGVVFRIPNPADVAELCGINPARFVHYDPIEPEQAQNLREYKAAVYAALPKRRPGIYARKTLARRLGVCERTSRDYDKIAGLRVEGRQEKTELRPDELAKLPENRKDVPGNVWMQDERGNRYQYTRKGVEAALRVGANRLFRVEQLANRYGPGEDENGG